MNLLLVGLVTIVLLKISGFGWDFFNTIRKSVTADNPAINLDKLRQHVRKLSFYIGDRSVYRKENLNEAAGYISAELKSYGYEVELQVVGARNNTANNIIAVKKGFVLPQEVIVVGAHYDTCFNPGADDNASGVAALLELARSIQNKKTARSVKFIAFVNEEPPFFKTEDMGSLVYAKAAKARKEDIKAALILECIGYFSDKSFSQRYPPLIGFFFPNKGNFISVVGNFKSRNLVSKVVKYFKSTTDFPVKSIALDISPAISFSDHWSFWKEGYPAVMVTDTAFLRNPYYHLAEDTFEKLNYPYMAEVVKGLEGVLAGLSNP